MPDPRVLLFPFLAPRSMEIAKTVGRARVPSGSNLWPVEMTEPHPDFPLPNRQRDRDEQREMRKRVITFIDAMECVEEVLQGDSWLDKLFSSIARGFSLGQSIQNDIIEIESKMEARLLFNGNPRLPVTKKFWQRVAGTSR